MKIDLDKTECDVILQVLEALRNFETTESLNKEKLQLDSIFENADVSDKSDIYIVFDNITKKIQHENERMCNGG